MVVVPAEQAPKDSVEEEAVQPLLPNIMIETSEFSIVPPEDISALIETKGEKKQETPAEKEKLISLMNRTDQLATDIGSIVEGQEAVELGIIDAVGGLSDAINEIKKHSEK